MRAFADSMANNDVLAELAVSGLVVAIIALLRWARGLRGVALAAGVVAIAVVSLGTKSSALAAAVPLAGLGLVAWLCELIAPGIKASRAGTRARLTRVSIGAAGLLIAAIVAWV